MNHSSILLRLILIIDENISDSWGIKFCVFKTDKV